MTPWQLVWAGCRGIIAASYSESKFFFWKSRPGGGWFVSNFIKNLDINLMMESRIESRMKDIPQVANIKTLLVVILDGFDGRQFVLVDPVHEFPRFLFFVSDFLNFDVEEWSLYRFDFALKNFPIFQTFCHPIIVQSTTALLVLPILGMSRNIDSFWIYSPCVFNFWCESVGNFFKFVSIR